MTLLVGWFRECVFHSAPRAFWLRVHAMICRVSLGRKSRVPFRDGHNQVPTRHIQLRNRTDHARYGRGTCGAKLLRRSMPHVDSWDFWKNCTPSPERNPTNTGRYLTNNVCTWYNIHRIQRYCIVRVAPKFTSPILNMIAFVIWGTKRATPTPTAQQSSDRKLQNQDRQ